MFDIFKKKEQKDPICGMVVNKNFTSKYGEKFCGETCIKEYEKKHKIDKNKTPDSCCS
jgi:YHS domain-containing protein